MIRKNISRGTEGASYTRENLLMLRGMCSNQSNQKLLETLGHSSMLETSKNEVFRPAAGEKIWGTYSTALSEYKGK